MKILKIFLLAIIILLFGQLGISQAAESMAIKVSPLIIPLELVPGKISEATITITNPNSYQIKILSEVEDFLVSDERGTPQFLPEGSGQTTLASWIKVIDSFTLEPNEAKEIPFQIIVPKDAEPGGHYGSILFKTQTPSQEGKLSVSGRLGVLILASVPGDISKKGEIVDFNSLKMVDKGSIDFSVRFKNTGTVHYQPKGKIQIYNWFGRKAGEIELSRHYLLPGSVYNFEEKWPRNYLFGQYKAVLEVEDGAGVIHTSTLSFFVLPWEELLIVTGLVLLLFLAVKTKKKIKNKKNKKEERKK